MSSEDQPDILLLTQDEQLLSIARASAGSAGSIHHATARSEAEGLAATHNVAVLLTDQPAETLSALNHPLALRAPGIVTVAVGERDAANDLLEMTERGEIYRFLLKPVSPGQLRLSIDAALNRHASQADDDGSEPAVSAGQNPAAQRKWIIAGALCLAVAAGTGGWVAWNNKEAEPRPAVIAEPADTAIPASEPAAEDRIGVLLTSAVAAMRERRYVAPEGDNAFHYYREILAENPNHLEASNGLTAIGNEMFSLAEQSIAAGLLDDAAEVIAVGRRILPGHPRIALLNTRLESAQQEALIEQARVVADEGELELAAQLLDEASNSRLGESPALMEARVALSRQEIQNEIDTLLRLAASRLLEDQLIAPPEDSAHFYLLAARRSGASEEALRPRTDELIEILLQRMASAIDAGSFDEATRLLDAARSLGADPELLLVEERALAEAVTATRSIQEMLVQARASLDDGRLVAPPGDNARQQLMTLRQAAPETEGLDESWQDLGAAMIERARAALAAGDTAEARHWLDEATSPGTAEAALADAEQAYYEAMRPVRIARALEAAPLVRTRYVPPDYPNAARTRGREGRVELAFTVDENGAVTDVSVVDARPPKIFNRAAIRALQQWEYEPVVIEGEARPKQGRVAIGFELAKD